MRSSARCARRSGAGDRMPRPAGRGGAGKDGAPQPEAEDSAIRGGALFVREEVATALRNGAPVVALESSVLAQGLPQPYNRQAAERMIGAVRAAGAVPAVTAVIAGRVCLGVTDPDLELLLAREGVIKVSARDLPVVAARGAHGATTVAAALAIARAGGVRVFATGGIGGVHREPPFDESADLQELARTQMVVVCAGPKAILDLPATFERLETLGVTVAGYGTDEAPGFFTRATGISLPARVDTPAEIARAFRHGRALDYPGALLILNPPPGRDALPAEEVDRAVNEALVSARREGIRGPAVTPYLLAAIERATGGRSVHTNVALLESNARLAADTALELARRSG